MAERYYCYVYANKWNMVRGALWCCAPMAWSRPFPCYEMLFLPKPSWPHPEWLLGMCSLQGSQLRRRIPTMAVPEAQQGMVTPRWWRGDRGQDKANRTLSSWCDALEHVDVGQAWLQHGLGEWWRGKPGLWKGRISPCAYNVILDLAVLQKQKLLSWPWRRTSQILPKGAPCPSQNLSSLWIGTRRVKTSYLSLLHGIDKVGGTFWFLSPSRVCSWWDPTWTILENPLSWEKCGALISISEGFMSSPSLQESIDLSKKSLFPPSTCYLSCPEFLHLPLLPSQFSARAQYIHFSSLSSHSMIAKKKLLLLLLIRVEGSSWSSDISIMFITNFGWTHQEVSSWNIPMASQMQNLSSNSRLFWSASWPTSSFQSFQISQHLKFEFSYPWFIHRPGLFSTQGLFGSAKCGERN